MDAPIGAFEAPAVEPADLLPEVDQEQISLKEKFSFLFAATGPGAVDSYINHPLNFSQSVGLGQVIRGLTGFLGSLEYAVVDLVIGLMRWRAESVKTIN